jgi:hypothetical protein
MNGSIPGFWGITDQSLQGLGRGAVWLLMRRHSTTDESALCAAIGGALACGSFGGVAGFAVSHHSHDFSALDGTILGWLLGVCIGFCFGAFVETVDSVINDLLRSLNPK